MCVVSLTASILKPSEHIRYFAASDNLYIKYSPSKDSLLQLDPYVNLFLKWTKLNENQTTQQNFVYVYHAVFYRNRSTRFGSITSGQESITKLRNEFWFFFETLVKMDFATGRLLPKEAELCLCLTKYQTMKTYPVLNCPATRETNESTKTNAGCQWKTYAAQSIILSRQALKVSSPLVVQISF